MIWSVNLVSNATVGQGNARFVLLGSMAMHVNMIAAVIAFQRKMFTKAVTFTQLHAHLRLVLVVSMATIV